MCLYILIYRSDQSLQQIRIVHLELAYFLAESISLIFFNQDPLENSQLHTRFHFSPLRFAPPACVCFLSKVNRKLYSISKINTRES